MARVSDDARCINLDWVEFYCLESESNFPCDADYFARKGIVVRMRDYGTRQYEQMFVVLDSMGNPFCEVRRKPVSGSMADRVKGIFSPRSCHIKLVNRYCYAENAMQLFSDFLLTHDYEVQRIFRLDICLDFEKFDFGDDPKEFLRRYMSGKYTKINQSNISAHGKDTWESRDWNSVSWGSPTSMVSTKFYCKTQELREAKDKPYIRYAWLKAGLVDDWHNLTKGQGDDMYKPEIWRVEFSIRSSARGWYRVEDNNGKKQKTEMKPHWPAEYCTRAQLLQAFFCLQNNYFHFKKFERGVRKDRCQDKMLFDFGKREVYRIDRLLTDQPKNKAYDSLIAKLEQYRQAHPFPAIVKATNTIIEDIQHSIAANAVVPYDATDVRILQELIGKRIKENPKRPLAEDKAEIEAQFKLLEELFKDVPDCPK